MCDSVGFICMALPPNGGFWPRGVMSGHPVPSTVSCTFFSFHTHTPIHLIRHHHCHRPSPALYLFHTYSELFPVSRAYQFSVLITFSLLIFSISRGYCSRRSWIGYSSVFVFIEWLIIIRKHFCMCFRLFCLLVLDFCMCIFLIACVFGYFFLHHL